MRLILQDAFNSFFLQLEERNYSPNTITAYASDLEQWADFLATESLQWDLTNRHELRSYLFTLRDSGLVTKRSQARKLSCLKSFFNHCVNEGLLEDNPLKGSKLMKYSYRLPCVIRIKDLNRLLEDDTGQKQKIQIRDFAIWELAYSTGLRVSELESLELSDIYDGDIKGSFEINSREVYLGKPAIRSLEAYLVIREGLVDKTGSTSLFVNMHGRRLSERGLRYVLKERCERLEIDSMYSPHSFRHTFARDLLDSGAGLRSVQQMLGHTNVSVTNNYSKVAISKMVDVFNKSHPHAKET